MGINNHSWVLPITFKSVLVIDFRLFKCAVLKPEPAIYSYLLQKLGQPASECIFVDDRVPKLLAARNLGMDVILFGGVSPSLEGKTARNFRELMDMLE